MPPLPPHQPSLVLATNLDCTSLFCMSQVGWQRTGEGVVGGITSVGVDGTDMQMAVAER